MARGLRRGPVLLRFRSLVDSLPTMWPASSTPANQQNPLHPTRLLPQCRRSIFRPGRLAAPVPASLSAPIPNQQPLLHLRRPRDPRRLPVAPSHRRHDHQPILPCFADWIGRLQRCKWLQHFQIFDARYLITLDGSRYFSSESVHCAHCLTTTKNGTTRYHHDILQAAIVHPDQRQVLPLAPSSRLRRRRRHGPPTVCRTYSRTRTRSASQPTAPPGRSGAVAGGAWRAGDVPRSASPACRRCAPGGDAPTCSADGSRTCVGNRWSGRTRRV